ncbi:radical SAM protein [Neomoorella humiferrea]|uniref:Pyrroloquinoline quinone biosynthesis protein PqqE n=1 Tax=Neomoorella humiferrea TaxID=676965 RepID=A0A2T0ARX5_9FIRM|nr:radical SAM protein [Moorella humiferrea]PRR72562.1 pyrroloquinoline quinone biosynthesis protein PqqE [Moorella humiferrea]
MKTAISFFGEALVKQGLSYIEREPEKNLAKLLNWAEHLAPHPVHKDQIRRAKDVLSNPESNWHQLVMRVFKELNPRARQKVITNFLLNSWLIGIPRQRAISEKEDFNVPYAILLDLTARCNLRCRGCWAGDYEQGYQLELPLVERLLKEAQELGIYFLVLSGGEPLVRTRDVLYLASCFPEMVFHVYTNGTLISEQLADNVAAVGNITFAISLEGFEEQTDNRRGKGVYKKVMRAMDILRERGIPFGFSATYTRENTEAIASDAFIDLMIEKGCLFGWLFTYVPVGRDADLELMATPWQRALMFSRVQTWRQTKPIAVFDFWNDGALTDGCIAGGRRYFHINAAGEVEPCAFIHYSTVNIRDVSMRDALRSPLMRAYQKRQPFNANLLRPCPLIDNPHSLADIIAETGAINTQSHAVNAKTLADSLMDYASAWGKIADELWEKFMGQQADK